MGDISPHFDRREFRCKCPCGADTVDAELIKVLEHIRQHFDRPVRVNSGHRCRDYNRYVGGSDSSQHLEGRAADIVVDDVPAIVVQELVENMGVGGLGRYNDFTHIDTRTNGPARWSG